MSPLELNDIQGNVLCGYNFPLATYLHYHFPGGTDARGFILALVNVVTSSRAAPEGDIAMNLAITYLGLRRLGVDAAYLATFPVEYREGMARRSSAGVLGDAGDSTPDHWEQYPLDGAGSEPLPVHLLIIIHARATGPLHVKIADITALAGSFGGMCIRKEDAAVLGGGGPNGRHEHFGFVDGVSQPVLKGAPGKRTAKDGGFYDADRGEWRELEAGEFVLGYPDEEEPHPRLPRPWQLVRNGSYLVYRKISQDVQAFNDFVDDVAARYPSTSLTVPGTGGPAEALAARFVGRLHDGQPLVPGHNTPAGDPPANDFRFAEDLKGYCCPYGSHIRRANPRDELNFGRQLVQRHRLIRRGMPYGPDFHEAPDVPRGLIFVAYCASIARQYEFIQRQWINNGDSLGLGPDGDPILSTGPPAARFVIQGRPPLFLRLPDATGARAPLVRVQWGEYFFQPGIRALNWLGHPSR